MVNILSYKNLVLRYLQFLIAEDFNTDIDCKDSIHITKNIISGKLIVVVCLPEDKKINKNIERYITAIVHSINSGHISKENMINNLIGFEEK